MCITSSLVLFIVVLTDDVSSDEDEDDDESNEPSLAGRLLTVIPCTCKFINTFYAQYFVLQVHCTCRLYVHFLIVQYLVYLFKLTIITCTCIFI